MAAHIARSPRGRLAGPLLAGIITTVSSLALTGSFADASSRGEWAALAYGMAFVAGATMAWAVHGWTRGARALGLLRIAVGMVAVAVPPIVLPAPPRAVAAFALHDVIEIDEHAAGVRVTDPATGVEALLPSGFTLDGALSGDSEEAGRGLVRTYVFVRDAAVISLDFSELLVPPDQTREFVDSAFGNRQGARVLRATRTEAVFTVDYAGVPARGRFLFTPEDGRVRPVMIMVSGLAVEETDAVLESLRAGAHARGVLEAADRDLPASSPAP
jgi:hypothetical protein